MPTKKLTITLGADEARKMLAEAVAAKFGLDADTLKVDFKLDYTCAENVDFRDPPTRKYYVDEVSIWVRE
jgi:hypothetical protein